MTFGFNEEDLMEIFDYEDIQLIPRKCIVSSRGECDTSIQFGSRTFKMPVVPANMQTVLDADLAKYLAQNDYFYVMHRFEPQTRIDFIKDMQAADLFASISVGIKADEYDFVLELVKQGLKPEYITIDIAHGHNEKVISMIKHIKANLPESFVIAGNIATPEAVRDLEEAGADATKVGVGPGKVCTTKLKTGFGTGGWQLAAINEISKVARKPFIADGGIRDHGDIAKSIRFGASMVMVGSLFAGHDESPGDIIEENGVQYKEYFGSASAFQKGEYKNVEGKRIVVPYKGPIAKTLKEIQQDLQSSISYSGGNSLASLREVDYVIVKGSIFNGDR